VGYTLALRRRTYAPSPTAAMLSRPTTEEGSGVVSARPCHPPAAMSTKPVPGGVSVTWPRLGPRVEKQRVRMTNYQFSPRGSYGFVPPL